MTDDDITPEFIEPELKDENKPGKLDRIKQHVKDHLVDNRERYLIGGAGVVVGVAATVTFMYGRQIVINDSFNFSLHSPKTNEVITTLIRRGHPGYLIRNVSTGEVYASLRRAAEANGINPGNLSRLLAQGKSSINGLAFEIIGEAV